MPSTVQQVFAAADLAPAGPVRWCEPVPETKAGVYVVALTHTPWQRAGTRPRCPLDLSVIQTLLSLRAVEVDGKPATVETIRKRLTQYWLPDETVLYIGRASKSVRKRVRTYYRTPLGAAKPHAGGWWLKTLKALSSLYVHFAASDDYVEAERAMLRAFAERVSPASKVALHDPARPMPFANREDADRLRKRHGITKDTGRMPPPGSYSPAGVCSEDHG